MYQQMQFWPVESGQAPCSCTCPLLHVHCPWSTDVLRLPQSLIPETASVPPEETSLTGQTQRDYEASVNQYHIITFLRVKDTEVHRAVNNYSVRQLHIKNCIEETKCIQRKSISIRTIMNKCRFLCLQKFLPGQSPGERQWRGDQNCTAQQDGSQLQKTSHPPKQHANHKNMHLNRNKITRNRASHCELIL